MLIVVDLAHLPLPFLLKGCVCSHLFVTAPNVSLSYPRAYVFIFCNGEFFFFGYNAIVAYTILSIAMDTDVRS